MNTIRRWHATFPRGPSGYTSIDLLAWLLCGWSVLYAALLPYSFTADDAFQTGMQYAPIVVMLGCSVILSFALQQARHHQQRYYRFACLALLATQALNIVVLVPAIPAFVFAETTQVSAGFAIYVLVYISLIASIGFFVPFWTFPRIPVLRSTIDAALIMALTDVLVRLVLPVIVPSWYWNAPLLACLFRLESTIGLFFWYTRLFFRFGDAARVPVRLWLLGFVCLLFNDATVLWTIFLAPANNDVVEAAIPFWMLNQTLWALALYRNRQSLIHWRTVPTTALGDTSSPLWQQIMRLVVTLATLAIVVAAGPSLTSVLWFFCVLVSRELLLLFEREGALEAERQARGAAEAMQRELEHINQILRRAQEELSQTNLRFQALSNYQAEQLKQRQLRAAEVAHDIGNLLQDAKLNMALVSRRLQTRGQPLPPDMQALLNEADERIAAVDGLLVAMVAAARLDAGALDLKLVPIDLVPLLQRVTRTLSTQAASQQVAVTVTVRDDARPVVGDVNLLTRALVNIVGNAIKFTGEARPAGAGLVSISVDSAGERVQIVVHDNGPGIDSADLERLGRPFVRGALHSNAPAGFGLGLALARGVIELHPGGALDITSALGEGTTVTVELQAPCGDDTLVERED